MDTTANAKQPAATKPAESTEITADMLEITQGFYRWSENRRFAYSDKGRHAYDLVPSGLSQKDGQIVRGKPFAQNPLIGSLTVWASPAKVPEGLITFLRSDDVEVTVRKDQDGKLAQRLTKTETGSLVPVVWENLPVLRYTATVVNITDAFIAPDRTEAALDAIAAKIAA